MSIPSIGASGIGALGFTPYVAPSVTATRVADVTAAEVGGVTEVTGPEVTGTEVTGTGATGGARFGDLLATGIDRLEGMHDTADRLAVQAATGDLASLHQYTIAATEASVATQLTVAVRNKALEAFSEIMRMPV